MSGSRKRGNVELGSAGLLGGAEHCVRGSAAVGVARDWHASRDEPRAEGGGGGRSHQRNPTVTCGRERRNEQVRLINNNNNNSSKWKRRNTHTHQTQVTRRFDFKGIYYCLYYCYYWDWDWDWDWREEAPVFTKCISVSLSLSLFNTEFLQSQFFLLPPLILLLSLMSLTNLNYNNHFF